jgi:hypothetical protein
MPGRPLPKRAHEALAACEAAGLMYWADHPRAQHVWAVDDFRRAHVVKIDRNAGTAQHVCGSTVPVAVEQCTGDDTAVPYAAPDEKGPLPS